MPEFLSTARLQLHKGFDLDTAAATVPYYASLGISHLYLSPIGAAVPGSLHGYDVIDPTRVNPELGGEEALRRLVIDLRRHDMGVIVDIVPNHMAASVDNAWWRDVLANGEDSRHAHYFDIDWQAPFADGKLWLPVLGESLVHTVSKRSLHLDTCNEVGEPMLACNGMALPLSVAAIASLLVATGLNVAEQECRAEVLSLWQLSMHDEYTRSRIKATIAAINGNANQLLALIDLQHYRLACWRTGNDIINYRRFFDISSLAALAVEHADVFNAVHALPLRLIAEGLVDGLRIDHVDGLSAPGEYLKRLRHAVDDARSHRPDDAPPRVTIHVEKILAHDEQLRADWPVDGATGYEFMDIASAVFHDPAGELPLRQAWSEISKRSGDFHEEERQARREMLARNLYAEMQTTVRAWWSVVTSSEVVDDLTEHGLELALAQLLECMPVYRTYLQESSCSDADREILEQAFAEAMVGLESTDGLQQLRAWLLDTPLEAGDAVYAMRLARRRLEQTSAPLNAKSVEDTAFYRHGVLVSRNEVGSDPDIFSCNVDDFHAAMQRRASYWPRALSATATHDHKRGEDTRARIAVLAQRPARFVDDARRWIARWNNGRGQTLAQIDPGDVSMLLQNMLGAWPLGLSVDDETGVPSFFDRLKAWQQKALREAKLRTTWTAPHQAYEHACESLLHAWLLEDSDMRAELEAAARALDVPGAFIGLSMAVLRLTAPGVPDLYQGTEFWDQSLVDPDNRQPVDYATRKHALESTRSPADLLHEFRDGRIKQSIVHRLLQLHRSHPQLFSEGAYRPLVVTGEFAERVIAFARGQASARCIVVVPRLCSDWLMLESTPSIPCDRWSDTALQIDADDAACTFRDVLMEREDFSGGAIPIRKLLDGLPVSVLISH